MSYSPTSMPGIPGNVGRPGYVYIAISDCKQWLKVGMCKHESGRNLNGYGGLDWTQVSSVHHRDNAWVERHAKAQLEKLAPSERLRTGSTHHEEAFRVSVEEMTAVIGVAVEQYLVAYVAAYGIEPVTLAAITAAVGVIYGRYGKGGHIRVITSIWFDGMTTIIGFDSVDPYGTKLSSADLTAARFFNWAQFCIESFLTVSGTPSPALAPPVEVLP